MAVTVVNDPDLLPENIYQVEIEKVLKFASQDFLDSITKKIQADIGIKKNNYYLLKTDGNVSWLQPTPELRLFHRLLRRIKIVKGANYLMITFKPKENV